MARRALIGAAAAAAALWAAPAAHAIGFFTVYGGGWAGGPGDVWLRAASDRNGETFGVSGHARTRCGTATIRAADVPVAAAEPMDLAGTTRRGGTETRWRLTGAIGELAGSGRLDATILRRGRVACSVSGRPWAVASASSGHQGSLVPPLGSRWFGTVDGGGVVALVVARRGPVVRRAVVSADLGFCPGRPGDAFRATLHRFRRTFAESFEGVLRRRVVARGVVRRVRVELDGTFFGDGVSGSLDVREIARRARDGRRLWACDSGGQTVYADRVPREAG